MIVKEAVNMDLRDMTLVERIVTLAGYQGITPRELAKACGFPPYFFDRRQDTLKPDRLEIIANNLGFNPEYIMSGDPKKLSYESPAAYVEVMDSLATRKELRDLFTLALEAPSEEIRSCIAALESFKARREKRTARKDKTNNGTEKETASVPG